MQTINKDVLSYLNRKKIPFAIKTDHTKPDEPQSLLPLKIMKIGKFYKIRNFHNSSTGYTVISSQFVKYMVGNGLAHIVAAS